MAWHGMARMGTPAAAVGFVFVCCGRRGDLMRRFSPTPSWIGLVSADDMQVVVVGVLAGRRSRLPPSDPAAGSPEGSAPDPEFVRWTNGGAAYAAGRH
jgi:hypothetical protein